MGRGTMSASRGVAAATSTHVAATSTATNKTFQQGLQSNSAVKVQSHLFSAPTGAKVHLTTNQPGQPHDITTFTKQSDGTWAQRQQVFTTTADSHFVNHAPMSSADLAAHLTKRRKAGDVVEARRGK